jgi:hypothetical protein
MTWCQLVPTGANHQLAPTDWLVPTGAAPFRGAPIGTIAEKSMEHGSTLKTPGGVGAILKTSTLPRPPQSLSWVFFGPPEIPPESYNHAE